MNKYLCRPWVITLMTLLLIFFDQATKGLAVRFLKGQEPFVIWDGVFELRYLENRGAAFGMLQGHQAFFLFTGLLVFAAALYFFRHVSADRKFFPIRMIAVFILAGALGNMADRLRLSYVVDFFYFRLIDFPIFNVADIYVTVSAAAFAVLSLFVYKEEDFALLFPKRREEKGR